MIMVSKVRISELRIGDVVSTRPDMYHNKWYILHNYEHAGDLANPMFCVLEHTLNYGYYREQYGGFRLSSEVRFGTSFVVERCLNPAHLPSIQAARQEEES